VPGVVQPGRSGPFTSTVAPASFSAAPHCDDVLAKIVKNDSRVWIDSTGIRTLEVSV
jgi:hypothetical protein